MFKLDIQLFADEPTPAETGTEPEASQVEITSDKPNGEVPTFATLEDYNKHVQSISSKAKGELLKEIGFEKVADIKKAITEGQSSKEIQESFELTKKELDTVKAELDSKNKELAKIEDDGILKDLGIPSNHAETFFTLVNADTSDKTRKEKAEEAKRKLLDMVGVPPRAGNPKQPKAEEEDKMIKAVRSAAGLKD